MKTSIKNLYAVLAFWLTLIFVPFLIYILNYPGSALNIITLLLNALGPYLAIKAVKSILDDPGYKIAVINVTIAVVILIIFIVSNYNAGAYYNVIQNVTSIIVLTLGCLMYKKI